MNGFTGSPIQHQVAGKHALFQGNGVRRGRVMNALAAQQEGERFLNNFFQDDSPKGKVGGFFQDVLENIFEVILFRHCVMGVHQIIIIAGGKVCARRHDLVQFFEQGCHLFDTSYDGRRGILGRRELKHGTKDGWIW